MSQVKLLGPLGAAAKADDIIARAQKRFNRPRSEIGIALARLILKESKDPAPAFSPRVRQAILAGRRPRVEV